MDSSMGEKVAQSYLKFYLIIKQKHVVGLVANIVNIQLILPKVKTLKNPYLPLINSKS
jgi:hypothetical protein